MRARAEAALIAVTLLWGATFVVVQNALQDASTLVFLALRFGLASIALAFCFGRGLAGQPQLRRPTLAAGSIAGVCLFAGYFTQTLGLQFTTASKSAFVTGLSTVLVPFLAVLVYQRAPHVSEILGVVVAATGLAMLTLPSGTVSINRGDVLTLGCAFAFAMHILLLGRWAPALPLPLLSVSQLGVTALLALAACFWAEAPRLHWTPRLAVAVAVTGLLATALAFAVQTWAQRHTTPTRTALIFALEPVSAAITSYVAEGAVLRGRSLAGAALILAGVLVVELKPFGSREHPSG